MTIQRSAWIILPFQEGQFKRHRFDDLFWAPGREEILQILLDGYLLLTSFSLFTPWEIPTRRTPANLSSPSFTQALKVIRGRRNARIEELVTKACSHASVSLELGLNVVIFWEAWERSCDVLTFTSIWYIIVSFNQCRRDQETSQKFIVMWYVKLVFTCCATFYVATKTYDKFSITKGN